MTTHKETLDHLERHERRRMAWSILMGLGLIAVFGGLLFLTTVPKTSRDMAGTIVSFRTSASESGVSRYVLVKLDGGPIINARYYGEASIRVGWRAKVEETTSYVIGWRRYRLKQLLAEGSGEKRPAGLVTK